MQPKTKSKSKVQSLKAGSKLKKDFSFPLEKENFIIIGAAIVMIIIGYILMAQNSVDGFVPTVISPIMLFIGYCVLIPYGILKKAKAPVQQESTPAPQMDPNKVPDTVKSNIKTS